MSQHFNTLAEWLKWQEGLHYTAIDLGLERCLQVAEDMNLLKPDFTVLSIAGTNGKGSSANMLDMILSQAGYKVACYTSPHLISYNERIRINGTSVSDDMLCQSFRRIDEARGDVSLTYFEFGTLAALDIFHQAGIELAVMEVGLGGRLDAVNMLDADVALLTTVDMDHQQWLGHDREAIGREKAGIFRPMRPAVCSDPKPPASVRACAEALGTEFYVSGQDFCYSTNPDTWEWRYAERHIQGLPWPGEGNEIQIQNAAGVLMVLHLIAERFPVSEEVVRACLGDFRLSGRFQLIAGEAAGYVLDVAHNRQAAEALAANLRALPGTGKTHLLLAMMKDKDHGAVVSALSDVVDYWYLAELAHERAAGANQLAATLGNESAGKNATFSQYNSVLAALQSARKAARPGDRIVVTGSFMTVAEASVYLQT